MGLVGERHRRAKRFGGTDLVVSTWDDYAGMVRDSGVPRGRSAQGGVPLASRRGGVPGSTTCFWIAPLRRGPKAAPGLSHVWVY